MARSKTGSDATLLGKAITFATRAHAGYEDPPAEPYIVHPMRVLLSVSKADDSKQDELMRCVAILHDVLERTPSSPRDLKALGMPRRVIDAVKLLTHDPETTYVDYVVRLKPNRLAKAVKLANLQDNADLRRAAFRPDKPKDRKRVIRYATSYRYLMGEMSEGAYRRTMDLA